MASKVLSIEIGYSLTKILEIDYLSKNPKVYKSFVMETPSDLFEEDVIKDHPVFSESIRNRIADLGIRTKECVFTVSSTRIASREVPIPANIKENRIPNLIKMNAKDYFPIDLTNYRLSYTTLRENVVEGLETKKYLLVLAAPEALIDSYIRFGRTIGLETVDVDYNGNSLYQVVKNAYQNEDTRMFVKVDDKSTYCMVLKGKDVVFTRNLTYGIDDAIETIIDTPAFKDVNTYLDAVDLARQKTCIYFSYNNSKSEKPAGIEDTQDMWDAKCKVTEAFTYLTGGISRVIDFYKSKNPDDDIKIIHLTGIGADFSGLQKLIANDTGIDCKVYTAVEGLRFEKASKELPIGEYITCIGASIAPVDFMGEKDAEKGGEYKKKDYMGAAILFLILCILICAVLLINPYTELLDEKGKTPAYEAQISEYKTAYQTYEEYLKTKYTYDKLNYYLDTADVRNNHINEFINEMEAKMPTTLRVQAFYASADGVSLSLTVDSLESAATLISVFRDFDSVDTVSVDSISVTTNEVGEGCCSFSISITYSKLN